VRNPVAGQIVAGCPFCDRELERAELVCLLRGRRQGGLPFSASAWQVVLGSGDAHGLAQWRPTDGIRWCHARVIRAS